jgi:PhnB protein
MAVKPIPEGYQSVTPYLAVEDAKGLIAFMKQAFDAQETFSLPGPEGKVGHAEVKIGDSMIMTGDSSLGDQQLSMPAMIHLYVEDSDKIFQKALEAGATKVRDLENMFYGDRSGAVQDRWGNFWWISTHVEDVPDDEMAKRAEAAMGQG